ncbi:MAG: hypothetical protein OQK75_13175 [Gammaproteobacteria bacterium]|nr:hypothetical protein [Gammaproteobacteria bacterium]MCW8988610.1 hypothetical protein [Gammaproteobacteria bacterium]
MFEISEAEKIEEAIQMLKTYAEEGTIKSFLSALEQLKQEPENEVLLTQLYDEFQKLGIYQGTVLTYATSIYHLISHNPFNE